MAKNKEVFEYQAKISVDMSHLGNQIGAVKKALKETDVNLKLPKHFISDLAEIENKFYELQKNAPGSGSSSKDILKYVANFKKLGTEIKNVSSKMKGFSFSDEAIQKTFNDLQNLTKKIEEINKKLTTGFDEKAGEISSANAKAYKYGEIKKQRAAAIEEAKKGYDGATAAAKFKSIKDDITARRAQIATWNPESRAKEEEKLKLAEENIKVLEKEINALRRAQQARLEKAKGLEQELITTTQSKKGEVTEQFLTNIGPLDVVADDAHKVAGAFSDMADEAKRNEDSAKAFDLTSQKIKNLFSATTVFYTVRRVVQGAIRDFQELDKQFNEIAIVSDYSTEEMWKSFSSVNKIAQEFGVTTKNVLEVQNLYYHQGKDMAEVNKLTAQTLTLAKITGMDYERATSDLTAALNAYNIAAEDAVLVTDSIAAMDTNAAISSEELMTALTKTASIAANAGMSLQSTEVFLTKMIETTREAPENLGTALKTIIARFGEVKEEINGEEIELADINKVDTALKGIGISLLDTAGQIRDLDDVFMELSAKWDDLDRNTQRYIATQAAGSRQQSRFIAMMEDYDRTLELTEIAQDSAGLGARQLAESMDSIETSMNRLKSTWQEFYANIINAGWIKDGIDAVNGILTGLNRLNDMVPGLGLIVGALGLWGAKILIVDVALKSLSKTMGDAMVETSAYKGMIDLQMSAMTSATLAEIAENEALEENIRLKAKAVLATRKLADAENDAAISQTAGNMTKNKPSLIKRLWNTMKEGASKNGEIDNLYKDFKDQKISWKNGLLSDKEFKAQRAATRQQAKSSLKGGLTKTFEPKLQKLSKTLGAVGKTIKTLGHVLGITAKGFALTTGAIVALTVAVGAAIWAWKKYGKASYDDTEQIKKLNEAQEKYNSSLKEQNAIKKNYKTYAKYESKGALSAEEMEERQAAAKALADEYPHLLDYIDDEGNYHLKNTSLIEDEIRAKDELLKKNAELYTKQRLASARNGVYSDTSTQAGAAIDKLQSFAATYDEDQLKKSGRNIDKFGTTFDNSRYNKMMQAFAEGKKFSFDEKDMSNLFAGQIGEANWEEFLETVNANPELLKSQEELTKALQDTGAYVGDNAEKVAKAFMQMDEANAGLFSELIEGAALEMSEIRVLQAEVIIEQGIYSAELTAEFKEAISQLAADNAKERFESTYPKWLRNTSFGDNKYTEILEEEAEKLATSFENISESGLTGAQEVFKSENLGSIVYGNIVEIINGLDEVDTTEEKRKVIETFYDNLDENVKEKFPKEYIAQMTTGVVEVIYSLIMDTLGDLTSSNTINNILEEYISSMSLFEKGSFKLDTETINKLFNELTTDQINALKSNLDELTETEFAPYLHTIMSEYNQSGQNTDVFNALIGQDFSSRAGIADAQEELRKFGYSSKEVLEIAIKAMNGIDNISMGNFESTLESSTKSLEELITKFEGVTALMEGTGSVEQMADYLSTMESSWLAQGESLDTVAGKMDILRDSVIATGTGFKLSADSALDYSNALAKLKMDSIQAEISALTTTLKEQDKVLSTAEVLDYKKQLTVLALEYARIDAASKQAIQDGLKKDLEEAKEKAIELRDALKDLVNWLLEFDRHQNLDRVLETLDYEFENLEFQIDFSTNADVIAESILSQFENVNTQLAVNNANMNAATDQKAMMKDVIEKNYGQYASFDEKGNLILDAAELQQLQETIANLKKEGKEGEAEAYQNIYDTLIKSADAYDTAVKKEREYAKSRQENLKQIAELEKQMLQNIVDEQDMVIEAIKEREDRELELVQEKYEAIDRENDKYLDSIQRMVDEERDIRDRADAEQDVKDKEKKLAMMKMDTSGVYASDIRALEKELEKDYRSLEDDAVDTAISKISKQYEADAEAREKELEYWTNYLEEKRRTGTEYYEEYYRIAAGGSEKVVEFMKQNDQEYLSSSKEKQELFEKDWASTCAKAEGSNQALGTSLYTQVATNLGICQGSALGFDGAVTQYATNVSTTTGPITGSISSMTSEYQKLAGGVQGVNSKISAMDDAFWEAARASAAVEENLADIVGMLPDMTAVLSALSEALKKADEFYAKGDKQFTTVGETSSGKWAAGDYDENLTISPNYLKRPDGQYYVYVNELDGYVKATDLIEMGTYGDSRVTAQDRINNNNLTAAVKGWKISKQKGVYRFAEGGYVDYTGPAWVDGTKSRPEYMLNATQTAQFESLIDALSMFYKAPKLSNQSTTNSQKTGDSHMEFHINIEGGISSDYDVDRAVERIEKKILDSGKYRNTTVIKKSN